MEPMETALSTDVIMDIVLSHLKVVDLLDCREVSKFWNKAASSVLRKRSTMIKNISEEKTLKKLEKCLKQSKDFPFAGLRFATPWKLSTAGARKFFQKHGARFTRLCLGTSRKTRLEDIAPFLNNLPRLSILEADWPGSLQSESLDSAAGHEDARVLKKPSLHTLRISPELNDDVLRQVCMAASPSLRIECLNATSEILSALKRVGKLQAVSVMNVSKKKKHNDDALSVDELLSTESPALTKLDFKNGGCISREGLMNLLIASQHTLKELRLSRISPAKLLSECPVLDKLTSLSVCLLTRSCYSIDEPAFQGSQGHKFPALQELTLDIELDCSLSEGLFIVPSLKRIHLTEFVEKDKIEDLARSFPNVIELQVVHENVEVAWVTDPTVIWSVGAFKKLEKLRIWNYTVQSPRKIYDNVVNEDVDLKKLLVNMDSFLTGIPITICENLRRQPQQNLKASPFNEILRDSPSLLQLKNLKELIICLRPEGELEQLPEEPPFISMVSVWYALELMPNLQAKFVYEPWAKPKIMLSTKTLSERRRCALGKGSNLNNMPRLKSPLDHLMAAFI